MSFSIKARQPHMIDSYSDDEDTGSNTSEFESSSVILGRVGSQSDHSSHSSMNNDTFGTSSFNTLARPAIMNNNNTLINTSFLSAQPSNEHYSGTTKPKNGRDGRDGIDGKDGRDGIDGKDGRDGIDGKDGRDGTDGERGERGERGYSTRTICWFGQVNLSQVENTIIIVPFDGTVDTLTRIMVSYSGQGDLTLNFTDIYTDKLLCTIIKNSTENYNTVSINNFTNVPTGLSSIKVSGFSGPESMITLNSLVVCI